MKETQVSHETATPTLYKRNKGRYYGMTIVGQTKEEVIAWRNYFYNFGAIEVQVQSINDPRDVTEALDRQENEIEEIAGKFTFTFFAAKDKILTAFETSEILRTELPAGGKLRQHIHPKLDQEIKSRALARLEAIPTLATV